MSSAPIELMTFPRSTLAGFTSTTLPFFFSFFLSWHFIDVVCRPHKQHQRNETKKKKSLGPISRSSFTPNLACTLQLIYSFVTLPHPPPWRVYTGFVAYTTTTFRWMPYGASAAAATRKVRHKRSLGPSSSMLAKIEYRRQPKYGARRTDCV